MVSELHGLSYQVCHSKKMEGLYLSASPDFTDKTQNPTVRDSCFKFTVPSLADFVVGDRDNVDLPHQGYQEIPHQDGAVYTRMLQVVCLDD